MITENYCSFEVAKLLKEKGFEQLCDYAYTNKGNYFEVDRSTFDEIYCYRPTLQMDLKWLREKYNILADIGYDDLDWFWNIISISEKVPVEDRPKFITQGTACHKTYEEAVETALKYVLTNLI